MAQISHGVTLFLKTDGTLWGMYRDLWSDMDTRDASADKFFLLMTKVKSIEPGGWIALRQNGEVWQWYDEGKTSLPSRLLPKPLLRATGVKNYTGTYVGTNDEEGYFITEDDNLWSLHPLAMWEGSCVMERNGPPQRLLKNVRSIVSSGGINYAVTHDNRLWVWGNNNEGYRGNDSNYGSLVPKGKNTCKPFVARNNVRQVFVDTEQIVIQSTDGRLRRRGWNEKNYSMPETKPFLPFTERTLPISNASYVKCSGGNGFFYLTDKHELRAYLYNDYYYTPEYCGPQFDKADMRPADARGFDVPFFEDVADFYMGDGIILKRDGTVLACGFEWDRKMKITTFDYYNKGYQSLVLPPTPENPVGLLDPAIEKILGARQEENAP
ncbi:MAG: hypothetical protein LBU06_06090 [Desulfovibrio sp.]|nr:hypothetical protein [Desulfovibrio sp.]